MYPLDENKKFGKETCDMGELIHYYFKLNEYYEEKFGDGKSRANLVIFRQEFPALLETFMQNRNYNTLNELLKVMENKFNPKLKNCVKDSTTINESIEKIHNLLAELSPEQKDNQKNNKKENPILAGLRRTARLENNSINNTVQNHMKACTDYKLVSRMLRDKDKLDAVWEATKNSYAKGMTKASFIESLEEQKEQLEQKLILAREENFKLVIDYHISLSKTICKAKIVTFESANKKIQTGAIEFA